MLELNYRQPVNWRHPLNRGMVGWWKALPHAMNSNIVRDLIRRPGNNGTWSTGGDAISTKWQGTSRPGGFGEFAFDGTDDYVANNVAVATGTPVTLSAWVYLNSAALATRIVGLYVSGQTKVIGVGTNATTGAAFSQHYDGSQAIVSSTMNIVGAWHHVCGVFHSDSSRSIYIDGILHNTNVTVQDPIGTINKTSIGRHEFGSPGSYFNGNIDEVQIWASALTATAVRNLYRLSQMRINPLLNWIDVPTQKGPSGGLWPYHLDNQSLCGGFSQLGI